MSKVEDAFTYLVERLGESAADLSREEYDELLKDLRDEIDVRLDANKET